MDAISEFFAWLFGSKMGVICLIVGGIVLCLLIAVITELRTRKRYFDHGHSDSPWNLFGDDEDEEAENR